MVKISNLIREMKSYFEAYDLWKVVMKIDSYYHPLAISQFSSKVKKSPIKEEQHL